MAKQQQIECVKCKRRRSSQCFSNDRIHKLERKGTCRQCVYKHYAKRRFDALDADERNFRRIAAQLAKCERRRGVRPFVTPSLSVVRKAVLERFKQQSSLSGARLALGDCCLARRDCTKPFDWRTNASLVSKREARRNNQ